MRQYDPTLIETWSIAEMFDVNTAAVGVVLGDYNVPMIEKTGEVSRVAFWEAFKKGGAALRREREKSENRDFSREAETLEYLIGTPSEETLRLVFIRRMSNDHKFKLVNREGRRRSLMTFEHPDALEPVRILTVVAMKTRASGRRCAFTVNNLDRNDFEWVVMLSKPWSQVFVRSRKEILERARGRRDGEPQISLNVTLTKETAQKDLLDRRVYELFHGGVR